MSKQPNWLKPAFCLKNNLRVLYRFMNSIKDKNHKIDNYFHSKIQRDTIHQNYNIHSLYFDIRKQTKPNSNIYSYPNIFSPYIYISDKKNIYFCLISQIMHIYIDSRFFGIKKALSLISKLSKKPDLGFQHAKSNFLGKYNVLDIFWIQGQLTVKVP